MPEQRRPGRPGHRPLSGAGADERVSARLPSSDLAWLQEHVLRTMLAIALGRENIAATYRRMARHGGDNSLRYLQHAERLDHSAAKVRWYAAQKQQQLTRWYPPERAEDTAG